MSVCHVSSVFKYHYSDFHNQLLSKQFSVFCVLNRDHRRPPQDFLNELLLSAWPEEIDMLGLEESDA